MPETINLGGSHTATIRTELTGADQKWWFVEVDRAKRANGSVQPVQWKPDPANPAQMVEVPASAGELTVEDNFTLLDKLAERLLTSWSRPEPLPWTPAMRDTLDLDTINALDAGIVTQMRRLQGAAPKPATSTTSGNTSPDGAPAPRTE